MSSDDQSETKEKREKKKIETSALDQEMIEEINRRLFLIEKIKSTKIRRSDDPKKEDVEDLPLPEVDSLIGYAIQGDSYHNDLELLHDRIKGEASAPEFVSPRLQVDDEELGVVAPQRTPSPFDLSEDEEGFEDIFAETSGVFEVQDVSDPHHAHKKMIVPRTPSPEPQILEGITLTSLEQIQEQERRKDQQQAILQAQQTLPNTEEILIQVDEESQEDEEDEWALDDLKGLMDFESNEDGDLLESESTMVDEDSSEGES